MEGVLPPALTQLGTPGALSAPHLLTHGTPVQVAF